MHTERSFAAKQVVYRYVVTETTTPISLDPLDADSTINLPVARMIYATPLEITRENHLASNILKAYQYDDNSNTIEWEVRSDIKFDDNEPITVADVVFAVLRMAHARPQFPVIENIEGIVQWQQSKYPLLSVPSGVKVNGNKISIKLAKRMEHPLFRFCLELFSIIPRKCVDLKSGKIICENVPASGYYRIGERTKEAITFIKRDDNKIFDQKAPAVMRFEYIPANKITEQIKQFDDLTIISGNEIMFSTAAMQQLEKNFAIKYAPAARFLALMINPAVAPFQDKKCRQYFARIFRESYADLTDRRNLIETSIFTKIFPGYLTTQELESQNNLSKKDKEQCKNMLLKTKIHWAYIADKKETVFHDAIQRTFAKIGVQVEPLILSNTQELLDSFTTGRIALLIFGSGLWSLDPAGDIKMLFTPNLHKPLQFVNSDAKLQEIIGQLDNKSNYSKLNEYIYAEAKMNIFSHMRRFYASSNKQLLYAVPFAITAPAPWQVFQVD